MNYAEFILIIHSALKEDIGMGDITTKLIIPWDKIVRAVILAQEDCLVCGLNIAGLVFKAMDKNIKFKAMLKDGQKAKRGKILARLQGRAQPIITAERVALNFLSLLSGIATATNAYVKAVRPYKVKIMDTRKTIPGLRSLQKYAVRTGGGLNHRMRLDGMVMVKDNHLKVTKGYERLRKVTKGCKVELEVKNLKELKEALKLKPDIIMLDNMKVNDIKKAIALMSRAKNKGVRTKLEASGGITLKNVRSVAATGVDMISIGALTHSLKSADISLEVANL